MKRVLLEFRRKGRIGLMDEFGNTIVQPEFRYASCSIDGTVEVSTFTDGFGFLDSTSLELKMVPGWQSSGVLANGLVAVRRSGGTYDDPEGYMDVNGELIIEARFIGAGSFDKFGANVGIFGNPNVRHRIDFSGKVLGDEFSQIRPFHTNGMACGAQLQSSNWMVPITATGMRIGKNVYKTVWQEHEGKIPVEFENDVVGWLDIDGKVMAKFRAFGIGNHFQNGLVPVQNFEGDWGLMNTAEEWVVDPAFDYIEAVGDNRFASGNRHSPGNLRMRLFDSQGTRIGEHEFGMIYRFYEGFANVEMAIPSDEGAEYGYAPSNYIDRNGNLVSNDWSDPIFSN